MVITVCVFEHVEAGSDWRTLANKSGGLVFVLLRQPGKLVVSPCGRNTRRGVDGWSKGPAQHVTTG